jgi:hypothetical protein
MTWLSTHKDEIGSAAAMVGVVVAVCGFGVTACQLQSTTSALRASNAYSIQKDARELVGQVRNEISSLNIQNPTPEEKARLDAAFWRVFNFYLAVYRQSNAGGISASFATSFRSDFCDALKQEIFNKEWGSLVDEKKISSDYLRMRTDWCGAA